MIKTLQMDPGKRLYVSLIAAIVLLLIALAVGAYKTNSLLTTRANNLVTLKAKSLALNQEQASLITAKKELHTYASLEQITQSVVPEDKDQAQTVRQIVNIAAVNGVTLGSITFPSSGLGASTSISQGVNSSAQSAAVAQSTNPNSSIVKLSQLVPVTNIAGVYNLSISVQSNPDNPVKYTSLINFLSGLEHNRRTAQISSISLQPKAGNPSLLDFSLTLNEYIKP
jgi:hypothetical protein